MTLTDGVARVEVAAIEVAAPIPPFSAGGDVRLHVGLTCDDFTGAGSSWVDRDVWRRFLQELERLVDRRDGEAVVESMSPNDLRLRIFATDHSGHMAIEGQARTRSVSALRWQFGAIQFDPSLLPLLLSELRAVQERDPMGHWEAHRDKKK
jgi:hypothetical protein